MRSCVFTMLVQRVQVSLPPSVLLRVLWEKGDQVTSTRWVKLNQNSCAKFDEELYLRLPIVMFPHARVLGKPVAP